ncbi:MAG: hypothetical protein GX587_14925, partial [Bacteroidales bacterium]|nr:hypothetical protein [Bacteroidales bacterium]
VSLYSLKGLLGLFLGGNPLYVVPVAFGSMPELRQLTLPSHIPNKELARKFFVNLNLEFQ